MKIGGIDFPEDLLTALRNGKLVVFAGAGVSMGEPANLPGFRELANDTAAGTGSTLKGDDPPERFLGRLCQQGVRVKEKAVQVLAQRNPKPTGLHTNILGLYAQGNPIRIVTTNFDKGFF